MHFNFIILFPIVVFAIFFIFSYRKKRYLLSFLSLIYLISFSSSLIIDIFYVQYDFNWYATLYLSSIIVIMIFPLFFIKTENIRIFLYQNEVLLLRKIATIIIAWSLLSLLIYLPYAISGLSGNIGANRINNQLNRVISSGYLTFLASIGANLFYLPQFLFFISLIVKWPKKIRNLLFISSFSVIIHVLANVGRDGFVLWIFTFILFYLLFKNQLNKSDKRFIKQQVLVILFVGVAIISAITISRFSVIKKYNYDVLYSVIDYQGQQLPNFNDTFDVVGEIDKTYYLTPNIKRIVVKYLGIKTSYTKDINNQETVLNYYGISTFVFKTYVMDLLMNFGYWGSALFAILFCIILMKLIKRNRNVYTLSELMFIVILVQIPAIGVYYFRQAISNFDLGLLLIIFLFIYLKINRGNKGVLV